MGNLKETVFSQRGNLLVDVIVGVTIIALISGGTFSILSALIRLNANGYTRTQAIWMGNSVMEIVSGYEFSEANPAGEVFGFEADETPASDTHWNTFDDVDDFSNRTLTFDSYPGFTATVRVDWSDYDETAGLNTPALSPPTLYKRVRVEVSSPGTDNVLTYTSLVAGEQNLSWIAGKVRNFSPVNSPRMVGNAAGTSTPHGIVGLDVTVNTTPPLQTVTMADNPATPADESGMYFIDNVPLGTHTITISGNNTFYDQQYPKEPVGPPRPTLTQGSHPTTLPLLLAGAALGNNRMDFISQPAVGGGLAVENETRSVTVTTKDLAGATEAEKINNLLTVHATTWDPGAVFGTGGGAVSPSYGAGTNTNWMEDFRFIEGVSVNWTFHMNAQNWVAPTTNVQYTQAQAQTAQLAGTPMEPWSLVTDPWGTLAVRLDYQDDANCPTHATYNNGFTWATLLPANGGLVGTAAAGMTHAARGWDGPDNDGDGFPDLTHRITHGGVLNTASSGQDSDATATIDLAQPYHYIIRWTGIGEAEWGGSFKYDNLTFLIDNVSISTVAASGGWVDCAYMNLVTVFTPPWNNAFFAPALDPSLYNTPPPPPRPDGLDWEEGYYEIRSPTALTTGVHTLTLQGKTGDSQFHYGSFYQIGLTLEPQRFPAIISVVSTSRASTDGKDNDGDWVAETDDTDEDLEPSPGDNNVDFLDLDEESTIDVTFSEEVWTTQSPWPTAPLGDLVPNDFTLSISGPGAALTGRNPSRPISVTRVGTTNTYTIAYRLTQAPSLGQVLTVNPVASQIYDRTWDVASSSQTGNNTLTAF